MRKNFVGAKLCMIRLCVSIGLIASLFMGCTTITSSNPDKRWEAVTHTSDQSVLAKVAMEDNESYVRYAAVEKLTDQTLLAKVAVEGNYPFTGKEAIEKMTDQALLVQVAGESKFTDVRELSGVKAFMIASQNGKAEIVRLLLDKGVGVNAEDEHGRTALMWASQKGRTEVVQLLLDKGANVNARHLNSDYVRMPNGAIAYPGATTTARDIASRFPGSVVVPGDLETALSIASESGNQEIMGMLIKAGAK